MYITTLISHNKIKLKLEFSHDWKPTLKLLKKKRLLMSEITKEVRLLMPSVSDLGISPKKSLSL